MAQIYNLCNSNPKQVNGHCVLKYLCLFETQVKEQNKGNVVLSNTVYS